MLNRYVWLMATIMDSAALELIFHGQQITQISHHSPFLPPPLTLTADATDQFIALCSCVLVL